MENRRKKYFIKQKLIGLLMLIFGAFSVPFLDSAFALIFAFGPLGLLLIFTKEMVWMDDYFCEVERSKGAD